MKNPFEKEDNSALLIGTLLFAGAAVGAATYLYITRQRSLAEAAARLKEHATDYLKAKKLKRKIKTDIHDIHSIVEH